MAGIEWIKLSTNIFSDEKIRLIKAKKNGSDYVLIWIELLCLAGRCNNGGMLTVSDGVPYDDEMLAVALDEKEQVIEEALVLFKKYHMIDVDPEDYTISITNWEKHQSTEKMDMVRDQTKKRMTKYRNKLRNNSVTDSVTDSVTVTQCYATDKDKDNKTKTKNKEKTTSKRNDEIPDMSEVLTFFNQRNAIDQAHEWFNLCERNDWKINGEPMQNWKAVAQGFINKMRQKAEKKEDPYDWNVEDLND